MALTIDYHLPRCIAVTEYKPEPGETSVIIPDGVHQVQKDAFSGSDNLESITLPESIRLIEDRAFKGCKNLREVIFTGKPELHRVCKDAFDDCPKMVVDGQFIALGDLLFKYIGTKEHVTVPDCFHRIADWAFDEQLLDHIIKHEDYLEPVYKLKDNQIISIFLPDSITEIGDSAFIHCTKLKSIKIPPKITIIKGLTFFGCESLESVELPSGIKCIESSAFEGCKELSNINLPDGLHELGTYAFKGCNKLKGVTLPPSLEIYECGALPGAQYKSVTGLGVKKIGHERWLSDNEPFYIFPKVKITRGLGAYSCFLLTMGYYTASDLYDDEVARTYDKYIRMNGSKLITFAKQRGIENIETFCIEHGYQESTKFDNKDDWQIVCNGIDYIPEGLSLSKYPDDFNNGNLPSNKEMKEFVDRNFFVYSVNGMRNAACYGKYSMALCILLLDGVLKSVDFHKTKDSDIFGSWLALLLETCYTEDARKIHGSDAEEDPTIFESLLRAFIKYGVVFEVQPEDKSDSIFVIRNYDKYLSDEYTPDLPEELLAEVNPLISNWIEEIKTAEDELYE